MNTFVVKESHIISEIVGLFAISLLVILVVGLASLVGSADAGLSRDASATSRRRGVQAIRLVLVNIVVRQDWKATRIQPQDYPTKNSS